MVVEAQGLSAAQMQAIARKVGFSETAFLFPPSGDDHDVWVRFFTPDCEVPVCGHATLAAQVARASAIGSQRGGLIQGSAGGRWQVEWELAAMGGVARMLQRPLSLGRQLHADEETSAMACLGIQTQDRWPRLPMQLASAGHVKAFVGLVSDDTLWKLRPDFERLAALSRRLEVYGWFVFSPEQVAAGRVAARMFAPALGIPEDPVNGSGQGPLSAILVEHRLLPERRHSALQILCEMGRSVGRRGEVSTQVQVVSGRAVTAWVGGAVVIEDRVDFSHQGMIG